MVSTLEFFSNSSKISKSFAGFLCFYSDKEAITKNQSPKDDPMTSQTDMMTQPSQRIICEGLGSLY